MQAMRLHSRLIMQFSRSQGLGFGELKRGGEVEEGTVGTKQNTAPEDCGIELS